MDCVVGAWMSGALPLVWLCPANVRASASHCGGIIRRQGLLTRRDLRLYCFYFYVRLHGLLVSLSLQVGIVFAACVLELRRWIIHVVSF